MNRAVLIDPSTNSDPTLAFRAAIMLLKVGYRPYIVSEPVKVKTYVNEVPVYMVAGVNSIIVPQASREAVDIVSSVGVRYVEVEGPAWIPSRELLDYTVELSLERDLQEVENIVRSLGFTCGKSACKVSGDRGQLIFYVHDAPRVKVEPVTLESAYAVIPTMTNHHITAGVDFREYKASMVYYGTAPAEVTLFMVEEYRLPVVTVHPREYYVRVMSEEILGGTAGTRLTGNILFFLLSKKRNLKI